MENSKALKALELMGYTFPKNKMKMINTLKELNPEHVIQIRDAYKHEYEYALRRMQDLTDSLEYVFCDICAAYSGGWADLPNGWGWHNGGPQWYLMCTACQTRYKEKFNELPKVTRKLEDEVIPESPEDVYEILEVKV